jgi:ABC-type branched-chain amino acid transport systems, ATPase component
MSLLQTVQLTKYFGDTHAVDHVDFSVREGEVLALIGSNGAGKTTLVNVISGLIEPDSGSIRFLESDVTQASIHEKIAVGIARSFQLVNLFDKLSALDNVALSIFSRQGKTRRLFALADADAQVRSEARGILDQFGLLPKAAVMAGGLSQGERKLLDVAVAYALKPKLLFLDEPTSGVSTREKAPIMDIITHVVRSERITAVIIEHDMDVVFTYCPRIVAMHQGAILADGTPDEIRNNEQVTPTCWGPTAMLEVQGLNTFRGPAHVLRDLGLRVGDAETVCLVGRNGAGKTTTIDSIMGLLPIKSGTVTLNGRDITRLPAHERALSGIGYSPEDAGIFPDLTVAENFQIGRSAAKGARGRGKASILASSSSSPRCATSPAGAGSSSPGGRRRW